MTRFTLLTIFVVFITYSQLFAQDLSDETLTVKKLLNEVHVDGIYQPGEWDDALKMRLDYETEPGNNTPATSETYFYLKYDADNIYFAFEALDDDPEQIRAFISDWDNVGSSDRVGIYLDPFNTNASAYDFTISASGVQMDGIIFGGGGGYDGSWDAIWNAEAEVNDEGYFVEAKLPLKSIRYPSSKEAQTWSISAWRKIPRSVVVETRTNPLLPEINCSLCQFNRVTGFEGLSENRNIEILPTYVGNKTDERVNIEDDNLDAGRINTSFGVDARIGITNNVVLNTTINPDFSQVEADAAQLNINNRFALRFREQRPFFQEGVEIFSTPEEVVFTRTIADPVFGTKLTGKFGKSEAAMLIAQDEINNLIFPSNDGSSNTTINEKVTTLLWRYKYTANQALSGGFTTTSRFSAEYSNIVNSLDAYYRPVDPLSVEIQYINSLTQYAPDVASANDQRSNRFSGNALYGEAEYDTREWRGNFRYIYRDENLRTDAGFIPQVDIKGFNYSLQKKIWSDGIPWFTRFLITAGGNTYQNLAGDLSSSQLYGSLSYLGPLQTSISVQYYPFRKTRYLNNLYELDFRFYSAVSMRPSSALQYSFSFDARDEVDYSNQRTGSQFQYTPALSLQAGPRLEIGLKYSLTIFDVNQENLFKANIFESSTRYNFTQRFFIRSIVQYRFTRRNPVMYLSVVNPTQRSLFMQWLLSYKFNQRSVIFLGYSDNYLGYKDEFLNRVDLTQTDRTIFFKVGYQWRF